jgi:hypothetical protein
LFFLFSVFPPKSIFVSCYVTGAGFFSQTVPVGKLLDLVGQ